ncbi:MAG: hypothetical protein J6P73_00525 [Bacteroidales bacterium]|nr:hypothetical protein [Bacteroidales bacterium]
MNKPSTFSIRNMVLAVLAITFAFAFSSCGDKNAQRFKDAAMNLDNTHLVIDEYDYWPNGDIRNIGGHLASLISLNDLEAMLPCPLYVSGPHHNGEWDLYNDDEFGHYNPQAIQYLANLAKKVVSDKKFVAASKPLIDKYLYKQMHQMMVLHDILFDEQLYDDAYRAYVFDDISRYPGYNDNAYYILEGMFIDDENMIYTGFGFESLSFWARRGADGTIDQFYQALSNVFMAYYPDYEYHLEDYYDDEYWGEGDWEYDDSGETVYSCELEEDEPVTDAEHIKESEAVEMIRTAAKKLDNTYLVLADEFDYWPECGIRVMGGHLFSLISLRTLNRMLPCELYVSGPHHYNRWNLEDPYDFGHYNPEAVSYLGKLAKKVVADKKFVEATKPLVDEFLERQMSIMKGLYDALNDENICNKSEVLESIMMNKGRAYYESPASDFLEVVGLEDGSYVYSNTGEMFLYFWGRRNEDGTMELFHDILETVYSAYYPE